MSEEVEEVEQIPTFLVVGDEIVDVLFTTWGQTGPEQWDMVAGHERVELPKGLERIVFELPVGCFEMSLLLGPDSTVSFTTDVRGDAPLSLRECRRPPKGFAEEVQSEDTPRVAE